MRAALVALLCLPAAPLSAQDFRVFTAVSEVDDGRPVELSRSLTLFHAGQAWDHAVESGQVVRFDPADAEFVILDTRRDLACTVKLEELARLLDVGRKENEKEIARLKAAGDPGAAALGDSLAFQLTPRFDLTEHQETGELTFSGGPLKYRFEVAEPGRPAVSARYWDFRDWTAKLNYMLGPGQLYPDVHRPLHEELRARGVVPQRIERTLADDPARPPLEHVSEHSFQEQLDPRDRSLILEWRERLASSKTRMVTFREYQRRTLGGVAQRPR